MWFSTAAVATCIVHNGVFAVDGNEEQSADKLEPSEHVEVVVEVTSEAADVVGVRARVDEGLEGAQGERAHEAAHSRKEVEEAHE